jgi:hypothetical protein
VIAEVPNGMFSFSLITRSCIHLTVDSTVAGHSNTWHECPFLIRISFSKQFLVTPKNVISFLYSNDVMLELYSDTTVESYIRCISYPITLYNHHLMILCDLRFLGRYCDDVITG